MKSRIWLAMFTLYIAWGTTYLAIHFAVESIPPFFMTGTRFLVAGLILYIWRRLAGDPSPTHSQWRSAIIIGTLLLVGGIGGVSLAEQYIPSGIAALVVASTPLWVVLIETFRPGGSRPTWQSISGVIIGMIGIFILVNPGSVSGHQTGYNLLGIVAVLLAALSWSIGSIYSHDAQLPSSPLLGTGMELLAGAGGSFIVGAVTIGVGLSDRGWVVDRVCVLYLAAARGSDDLGGNLCLCEPTGGSIPGQPAGWGGADPTNTDRLSTHPCCGGIDPRAPAEKSTSANPSCYSACLSR
jgi:drug/metabolite transporter (DMT)-like permease